MGTIPASDGKTRNVSLDPNNYQVLKWTRYRGLQRRVAIRLGLSESSVWNVLHSRSNNARISAAIAAEIKRCDAGAPSTTKKSGTEPVGHRLSKRYPGLQNRVALHLGDSKESVSRVALGKTKSVRISASLDAEIARIEREQFANEAGNKPRVVVRYYSVFRDQVMGVAETGTTADRRRHLVQIGANQRTVLSGNGARAQETRPCEMKAQPATASPDTASCGANGEVSKPAPDSRADSPSSNKPFAVLRCVLACDNGDVYATVDRSHVVTKIGRNEELGKIVPVSRFIYPRGPLVPIELYSGLCATGEIKSPSSKGRAATPSRALPVSAAPLRKFIPLIEVAKALGVGRDTVVRMIKDGKLCGYQLNAKGWWRVTAESFDSYRKSLRSDLEAVS